MNQLMYMRSITNGMLLPIGEEIGTIVGSGIFWFRVAKLNTSTEIAVVSGCNEGKSYPHTIHTDDGCKITESGVRINIERYDASNYDYVSVSVRPHPQNGLPKFPLKLITVSKAGQSIGQIDFISDRVKTLESKQLPDSVYVVVKKNTLNCASENLSAHVSKDEAYKEALSLTRAVKDNKFLFDVEEVSVKDKVGN